MLLPLPDEEGDAEECARRWSMFFRHLHNAVVGQLTVDFLQPFLGHLMAQLKGPTSLLPYRLTLKIGRITLGMFDSDGDCDNRRLPLLFGEGRQ